MAAPTSFRTILKKWCEEIKPKNILEWGPGISTQLMEEVCPKATIYTFEHLKQYSDYWKVLLKSTVFLVEDLDRYCKADNILFETKFDLIFVDGRRRVDCLRTALKLIRDDGVVILHDAERNEYNEGIELFDKVEYDDGTVVLKKKV